MRWRFSRRTIAPTPERGGLAIAEPSLIHPRAPHGYKSATWVGHSTVLLQLGPLNVLTDPVWSERASPFQWIGPRRFMAPGIDFDALPPVDIVLLSHNHYDHLDGRTVERLASKCPAALWLAPLGLAPLLRSFGVGEVEERDWWETVDTPLFSAACTPARHFSARGIRDRGDTLWCGWTMETDGASVFFAGDTAVHPEFATIGRRGGPFDLVMLPVGAYEPRWIMGAVHMNPEEAVDAYRAITSTAKESPPCLALHWGTFRLTDEPADEPPERFVRRWLELGLPEEKGWALAHGETRVF
jgi:N-acyl-phosphatidylethanolamine-hydrolysing phospholipase D